jgi:hypothetical protein
MLDFLLDLAVFQIMMWILWDIVGNWTIALIFTLIKVRKWAPRLQKGIGAMIYGSFYTSIIIKHLDNGSSIVLLTAIGTVLLILNFLAAHGQTRQAIAQSGGAASLINSGGGMDWEQLEMEEEIDYDWIYWLISLVVFTITFFVPEIGENPINTLIVTVTEWTENITILNYVLNGFAGLFMLAILWKGISLGLIGTILATGSKDKE